jgi:type II secretory pathway pseudopilin PulG
LTSSTEKSVRENRVSIYLTPAHYPKRGLTMTLMVIALPAFIGAMGLAMDVGNLYFNHRKMQTAVDAAVLAGAQCLPGVSSGDNVCNGTCGTGATGTCTPSQTASHYATTNGILNTDTITGPTVSAGDTQISMTVNRNVNYYFARLVGLNSGTVSVTATAEAGALGTATNVFDIAMQYCGTPDASACFTQYSTYNLTNGSTAPGNWGPINPASSGVSLCPSPASGCLPVSTGCASLKDAASAAQTLISDGQTDYPSDTPQSFSPSDPRLVTIPLVDWGVAAGKSTELNVYGFAEFFLTSVTVPPGCSGGGPIITGQFVNAVAVGTVTTSSNADLGATTIELIE